MPQTKTRQQPPVTEVQANPQYVRFYLKRPHTEVGWAAGCYKSGAFGSKLPESLRRLADELKSLDGIETFHYSLGGWQPDHLSVKFHQAVQGNDEEQVQHIAELIVKLVG